MQCGPRFIKIILEPLPNGLTSFKLSEHTTFSQGQSHILHKFFLVEMVNTIIVPFSERRTQGKWKFSRFVSAAN
jgi:hypothetical protein